MQIGKQYKINVDGGTRVLTYTAVIISNIDGYISFKDKFGKIITYREDRIISFEEAKNA